MADTDWRVLPSGGRNLVVRNYHQDGRTGLATLPESCWSDWSEGKAAEVARWANENLLQVKPHLWWSDDEPRRMEYLSG